jgi:hypothetical protein
VEKRFWRLEQDIRQIEDRLGNLGDPEFAEPAETAYACWQKEYAPRRRSHEEEEGVDS